MKRTKSTEKTQVRKTKILNAISDLFNESFSCEKEEDVARVCLSIAEKLTGSKFGFLGQVNQKGFFDTIALSDPGWNACRMPKTKKAESIKSMEIRGIWGEVIKTKKALIVNNPSSHFKRTGVPKGLPPINSFLGVPLFLPNQPIGMIALANKDSGYTKEDQEAVNVLSFSFVEVLIRKRAEFELNKHKGSLEELVKSRTKELNESNQRLKREIKKQKQTEKTLRESEGKYKILLENLPQKIFTKNKKSVYLSCNRNFARDLGITPEQFNGKTDYDFFPKHMADKYRADDLRIIKSGKTEEIEERYIQDGKEAWVQTTKTPLHNETGKVVGILGIFRDITEQKKAVDALAISERELAVRNEIANIFLTTADEDMFNEVLKVILKTMNSKYGVFGFIDEDGALVVPSMTRHIWDKCKVSEKRIMFPRDTWGKSTWHSCLKGKKPICMNRASSNIPEGHVAINRHISMPIVYRNESIGLLQVANKKKDYEEKDIQFLGMIADSIAPILSAQLQRERQEKARKKAEDDLKKTLTDFERSNKDLEQFAYIASHDLQEPLRMVASFMQLLAQRYRDKLDDDAREFIGYAVEGASRMQALINDLLTFSRVGTRGRPFDPVDMEEVLGQVHSDLRIAIEESRTILTHDELPLIWADKGQVIQLLQNLIANSIKFRGDEAPRIHISAQLDKNEWIFSIKDNGIGMDCAHAERIFLIFQRLHERNKYPGTGVGLAVAKKIVERHGGRIWVESQPGKGAIFFFTMPVHREAIDSEFQEQGG